MKTKWIQQHLAIKLIILQLTCLIVGTLSKPCVLREYKTGLVCVCNATYCDTLEFGYPNDGEILILSTSKSGLRFEESKAQFGGERFVIPDKQSTSHVNIGTNAQFEKFFNSKNEIFVNRSATFQKIVGFGNSFTGAVSHNLNQAPSLKENIFKSYYSKDFGNAFNMIRTPIGGCDFDLAPWAYNEWPENDLKLSNFTELDLRDVEKVERLKELMAVSNNFDIKFIGAAWSSPKWMKTNNEWTGFGALKDVYYQTWADYHVKFLELMRDNGIDFWAITTGNEPLNGVSAFLFIKFMSLGWLPTDQGKWVAENLGPSLRKSSLAAVKILAGDDQRYTLPWWFTRMYEAYPDSRKFVDGHAVHWYWDKYASANLLDRTHANYPEKLIIATEACSGDKPWEEHRPLLGYWPRCEDYIVDIIEDLNHHVNAWIDWNILLDEAGGPNYVDNFVDSPMVINTTNGAEFYKQPTFYAMGHFSRFLPPDSVRLASRSTSRFVIVTAFRRPDGYTAIVVYNSANHALDVDVNDSSRGVLKLTTPAKSIHTLIFK